MKLYNKLRGSKNGALIVGSAYSLGAKLLGMLFFLLADILFARKSGVILYGEWAFYYAILTMCFWLINFGITPSSRIHIARADRESSEALQYCKSSMLLRLAVSGVVAVSMLILLPIVTEKLGFTQRYVHLKILLAVGSVQCFFYSWVEYFKEVFIGLKQFRGVFVVTVLQFFMYFLLGACVFLLTSSILFMALGYLLTEVITGIIGLALLQRYTGILTKWKSIPTDVNLSKEILRYARPIFLINIGALILTEMDSVMLGVMSREGENGLYAIAKSLSQKMTHINLAISTVVMTEFAVITRETCLEKKQKYVRLQMMNTIGSFSLATVVYILAPFIIRLLYGEEYMESATILRFLLPYYVMYAMNLFSGGLLDYQKKARQRLAAYAVMILLNLILNMCFIPSLGGRGAALATCLSVLPYTVSLEIMAYRVFRERQNDGAGISSERIS